MAAEAAESLVLTVFFEGTSNTLRPPTTQLGVFYHAITAQDITERSPSSSQQHYKIGFDGCGEAFGTRGVIFAHGLEEQCHQVESKIKELLPRLVGNRLKVVVVGLSRGGCAAIILANRVAKQHPLDAPLDLQLLLFDPVPGNLISVYKTDLLGVSTASKSSDLRKAVHVRDVLALYPYQPLPTFAFHAPVLPKYPEGITVEEDVTLGCHQGALFRPSAQHPECVLACVRVHDFLRKHGVVVDSSKFSFHLPSDQDARQVAEQAVQEASASERFCHSSPAKKILRFTTGRYLNRHHWRLQGAPALSEGSEEVVFMLDIRNDTWFAASSSASTSAARVSQRASE